MRYAKDYRTLHAIRWSLIYRMAGVEDASEHISYIKCLATKAIQADNKMRLLILK